MFGQFRLVELVGWLSPREGTDWAICTRPRMLTSPTTHMARKTREFNPIQGGGGSCATTTNLEKCGRISIHPT